MSVMVEYVHGKSLLHRLNPLTKLIWTFLAIALSFMFSSPFAIFSIFLANVAVAAACGVIKKLLPAIKGLLIFALILILFQIFFVSEGNTLFYIIPFTKIGRITDTGLQMSLVMAARMLATVSPIPILMLTTPMTDLVVVMVDKLKVPFKYAFMFITALRFIPSFMAELETILQAQMSRGYVADTRNPIKKFMIVIPLAVPLLVSSVKKTERMAVSMEARGFGSGPRSSYRKIDIAGIDYAVLAGFAAILCSAVLLTVL